MIPYRTTTQQKEPCVSDSAKLRSLSKALRPWTSASQCVYAAENRGGSGLGTAQDNIGSQDSLERKQTLKVSCSRVGLESSPPDFRAPGAVSPQWSLGHWKCGEGHQLAGDPISLKAESHLFQHPPSLVSRRGTKIHEFRYQLARSTEDMNTSCPETPTEELGQGKETVGEGGWSPGKVHDHKV